MLPNQRHRVTDRNHAAVGGHIAHPRGGHAAEECVEGAQTITSGGPTQTRMSPTRAGGRPPTSVGMPPGGQNRPADVGHEDRDHRADVHVRDAGTRHSHVDDPKSDGGISRSRADGPSSNYRDVLPACCGYSHE